MNQLPEIDEVGKVDVSRLRVWMGEQQQSLVDDLIALAKLETPSDDLGLLTLAGEYAEQWIVRRLGEPRSSRWSRSSTFGPVLVLDYPGTTDVQLVALGHFDTVFPAGTLSSWPVSTDGDRLTGPGVFDMKAGLVQMVWALKCLDAVRVPRPAVRIVLSSDEEIGSHFSRPLIEESCEGAAAVLVFEGSARSGAIKTARKGVGLFAISAEGVEAHAGLDPDAGASAIDEIARAVRQLHDASNLEKGTSINVGTIEGGTRANVTAGTAVATVDVRVADAEEQHRVERLLRSLRAHHPSASLHVTGSWNRPIMARTEDNIRMYEIARAVAHSLGAELGEASVGGASDGNFVAALGIPVLDGLGGVGSGAHARHESVSIAALAERATLASGVIATFAA